MSTARLLFRAHLENGIAVSLCLAAVALTAGIMGGLESGVFAAIGGMCVSIVDQPGPWRTKLAIFLAALLLSSATLLLAGLSSGRPWAMAGLVTVTSLVFAFATAFGRSALMLAITGVLALVIGLAVPTDNAASALQQSGIFFAGGAAYAALAMAASRSLDDRNRRMFLNEALLAFAAYLRARADLYDVGKTKQSALANVIERHGVLTERLQTARDTIFTGSPTPKRRKWIAGMLALLDLYETVLSSDADWESLREAPDQEALRQLSALSLAIASDIDAVALALVSAVGKTPACEHPEILVALDGALERLVREGPEGTASGLYSTRTKMRRALRRTRHLAEVLSATQDTPPALPTVALAAFLQPPMAPWRATVRAHLTLVSPVTRYAIRLTSAMLVGYAVTLVFPTYVHGGWVLLTVALIMRASYAITRQRRNDRLLGTLAGCAVAAGLIPILPTYAVVAIIIIGVGLAHAYATVNYKITSFTASLMALLLLHFLEPQTFYVGERIIDTLIGAGLSIMFARVLPSWEWNDVPRLMSDLLAADRAFATQALTLDPNDQSYRLARKQALDRFTALATTVRRLSSEPHHDHELTAISELLAANYLFASDLASVQGILHMHAGEVDTKAISALLNGARDRVTKCFTMVSEPPPPATLRRRSWFELSDTEPETILRRRLLHIEHSAQRLIAQAANAGAIRQRTG